MYSQETADKICARLAEGESLRSICRDEEMPSTGSFLRWVSERAELAEQYAHARALCLDAMAEDILDIADTPQVGQKTVSKATGIEVTEADMVEHRRLRIESRKWLMAKMAPKKYGDKVTQEHTGPNGGPVQSEHTLKLPPDEYERLARKIVQDV